MQKNNKTREHSSGKALTKKQNFFVSTNKTKRFIALNSDKIVCKRKFSVLYQTRLNRGLDSDQNVINGLKNSHIFSKHNKDRFAYASRATNKPKVWLQKKSSIFSLDQKFGQPLFVESNFYRLNSNRKLEHLYGTNLEKMSFLSSDLANLALSSETYTFLKQKDIHKVGNLAAYSQKTLFEFLNRNRRMFAEIKRSFIVWVC